MVLLILGRKEKKRKRKGREKLRKQQKAPHIN